MSGLPDIGDLPMSGLPDIGDLKTRKKHPTCEHGSPDIHDQNYPKK
jgi:hypothetical protein